MVASSGHQSREIERLDRPSPRLFQNEYLAKGRPVIIRGVASQWPAAQKWTPDYFRRTLPDNIIQYAVWPEQFSTRDPRAFFSMQHAKEPLAAFVDRMDACLDRKPRFYCGQYPLFRFVPKLQADVGSLAPYLGQDEFYPDWLDRRLGSSVIKQYMRSDGFLWLGPAGIFTPLHFDASHNMFVQFHGRKKWTLIPPEQSKCVYFPFREFPTKWLHMSPVDPEYPDLKQYPLFARSKPISAVIEPGEMLFIPAGWWHAVEALDASVSMNFWWLSPGALWNVKRYMLSVARRSALKTVGLARMSAWAERAAC